MMDKDWKEKLTPTIGITKLEKLILKWWHGMPIQNLQDMRYSWVGFLYKYFPDLNHPYHLSLAQLSYIFEQEYLVTEDVLLPGLLVINNEGTIGTVLECDDMHNIVVKFVDGTLGLHCLIKDCVDKFEVKGEEIEIFNYDPLYVYKQ